jgi:hypothetical protein
MVLDEELAGKPRELLRILAHEIFHFVWARLGNEKRRSYQELLQHEWKQRARGELGWSAESRKSVLPHHPPPTTHRRLWSDYACESFCDTAAWLYSGVERHEEFTLGAGRRRGRRNWFAEVLGNRNLSI